MLSLKLPKPVFQALEVSRWMTASLVLGLFGFWYIIAHGTRKSEKSLAAGDSAATATDPGLIKKGTTFQEYATPSGHTYPRIRTFFHVHPKSEKLPLDIPLLVFMHGLGGSAAQFAPLMTSLVNIAPCLAIDLPGCGLSDFKPGDDAAYTTTAFAELLYCAIDRFRNKEVDQKVIIVGHSMGCSISSLLVSSTSPMAHLCSKEIIGMIAICPRSTPLSKKDLTAIRRLNWIPSRLFDIIRLNDRRGGVDSASVVRVVGKDADLETRRLQLRFNEQSRSPVFQKFCKGLYLLETSTASAEQDSLLGQRVWSGIRTPLFLVAAENDKLAPPREAEQIATWLTQLHPPVSGGSVMVEKDTLQQEPISADKPRGDLPPSSEAGDGRFEGQIITSLETELVPTRVESMAGEAVSSGLTQVEEVEKARVVQSRGGQAKTAIEKHFTGRSFVLKTSVFPSPSAHSVLYATADARILSGLIENFTTKYVDVRLSPGWQLQHLTTSGKWDVKNLKKWRSIERCSAPIGGVFRAMKTMREVDDVHCPREFVKTFSYKVLPDGVATVVDISHETPVYDKTGLEEGGVDYYKFPTVSKLPPMADEVEKFTVLIDDLRQSPKIQQNRSADGTLPTIGVHCHYGFNRTGFFIVCYLVERLGWKLQDAIDEFATKRLPGIKHDYFINELYVRYAVKMERRGTVIA